MGGHAVSVICQSNPAAAALPCRGRHFVPVRTLAWMLRFQETALQVTKVMTASKTDAITTPPDGVAGGLPRPGGPDEGGPQLRLLRARGATLLLIVLVLLLSAGGVLHLVGLPQAAHGTVDRRHARWHGLRVVGG